MECIFCNQKMTENGFFDFVCLNHPKKEAVRASKTSEGIIFTKIKEEAILVRKDGSREKIPISKALLEGVDVMPVSDEIRKIIRTLSRKEVKGAKRHAIVVVF